MYARDLMTHPAITCHVNESLSMAAHRMWEQDCGSLPVVNDDGKLTGMITDRDICMCALHQGQPLSTLRVADAMSRTLTACAPRDKVSEVEQLMRSQQVRRLPVIDKDGSLCGIVSLADLAREASSGNGNPLGSGVSGSEVGEVLASICEPDHRNDVNRLSAQA